MNRQLAIFFQECEQIFTSQEGVVIHSGLDALSLLTVGGSWHVERLWEVVVFPASFSPEERFVSDLVNHFRFLPLL